MLHHIIIRGIERRKTFRDNKDKDNFVERLAILLPETKTKCYGWALMSNHAHFLFRSGSGGIAHLMRRLLTGYAVSFNRRHRRHGQLFQNRYKSIICQEDQYFRELIRYIHLNPLRAKIVPTPGELMRHPYSGHSVLVGKKARQWQDDTYVLGYFGKTVRKARGEYERYVIEGIAEGKRNDLTGGGLIRSIGGWKEVGQLRLRGKERIKSDKRILGDSDFVERVLRESEESYAREYALKKQGVDFDGIAQKAAKLYEMETREIVAKGRQKKKVEARSLLCYWAVREIGMGVTEVGRRLGMTASAVGYAVERGEKIAREKNYELMEKVIE